MNRLKELYNRYIQLVCGDPGAQPPLAVLQNLIEDLRQTGVALDDDAVCFVMASRIWGGTIAQLTHEPGDYGYVNRASDVNGGFLPRDLCGSARRKNCGMATAVRVLEPGSFLAQDHTGTLYDRAQLFERILMGFIEQKLARLG